MEKLARIARLVATVAVLAVVITGCSRTSGRQVDVTAGEYYSEEEYLELSNGEKENYTVALEQELAKLQGQVESRRTELTATRKQIESLRNQITPIERELLRVESDIRTLTSQIAELEALPQAWNIVSGECLWLIAGYEDVYSDPVKWPRIFRANMDKIEDPHWIYPDTLLVVPRNWPTEHRVSTDESLAIIASYWEVYGSALEWTKLYEGNKNLVKDPDFVLPDQLLLRIPRAEEDVEDAQNAQEAEE